jgi:uncharacterized damage-inducible protein DinB
MLHCELSKDGNHSESAPGLTVGAVYDRTRFLTSGLRAVIDRPYSADGRKNMVPTSGTATTEAQEFIEASRFFLKEDFLPKLIHCVESMSDDDVWWRPNEQSNSVGNLMLHLCGNLRQWIVSSIGGTTIQRDRDAEFKTRDRLPKAELIGKLRAAVDDVDGVLATLPARSLLQRHTIQKYNVSGLNAIYHVVEHFSYHLGQILYIYKLRTGSDPGFYRHLSSR